MKLSLRGSLIFLGLAATATVAAAAETGAAAAAAAPRTAGETIALAIAACLTMAISVLGAGAAVGRIGAAALGAAAEKPDLLTRSILFRMPAFRLSHVPTPSSVYDLCRLYVRTPC